jgi:transcriptional regulator with XRE-family HTH domain
MKGHGIRHHLRDWRKRRGLSQQALADAVGLTKGMISRYESAQKHMHIEVMLRLFEVLNVTAGEFFTSPPNGPVRADPNEDPSEDPNVLIQQMVLAETRERALRYIQDMVVQEKEALARLAVDAHAKATQGHPKLPKKR